MGKFLLVVAILLIAAPHAFGQQRDTIRSVSSDSVVVIGVRKPNISTLDARSAVSAPAPLLVLRANSTLASSALSTLASSLDVRRYGPFGSAFLTFRGLPAEYTVFYRDGIRIPSEQNSLVDVGQVALDGVDRVELVPSAEAVILGGDAIGAAVNLVSRVSDTARVRLRNQLENFNAGEPVGDVTTSALLSLVPVSEVFLIAGASDAHSTGRYPFVQQPWGDRVVREANDATLLTQFGNISWTRSDADEVRAHFNHFTMDRGLPGAPTVRWYGAYSYNTREFDEQTYSSLAYLHRGASNSLAASLGYQHQYESYTNPASGIQDSSQVDVFDGGVRWSGGWKAIDLFTGVDYATTRLAGTTNALPNGDSIVSRSRTSAYIAASTSFASMDASAALRAENVSSDNTVHLLPQLTWSVAIVNNLLLHVAYGRSFHAPTLNELYWSSEGGIPNPALLPERGESWSAMLHSPLDAGDTHLEFAATYFHTAVQDEILWLSSGSNTSMAQNLGEVVSKGVEVRVSATAKFVGIEWTAEESYTVLDARLLDREHYRNEVPFSTPSASLLTLLATHPNYGSVSLTAHYRGHRYTDPGNSEERKLQPMQIIDVSYTPPMLHAGGAAIQFQLGVNDITNVRQEELGGYPLPARSISLTTSLTY